MCVFPTEKKIIFWFSFFERKKTEEVSEWVVVCVKRWKKRQTKRVVPFGQQDSLIVALVQILFPFFFSSFLLYSYCFFLFFFFLVPRKNGFL